MLTFPIIVHSHIGKLVFKYPQGIMGINFEISPGNYGNRLRDTTLGIMGNLISTEIMSKHVGGEKGKSNVSEMRKSMNKIICLNRCCTIWWN